MTTPIADISKQILAMQDDLASALEAERVAKADLDEASHNFATQKKDVWEATGHYIRAQKRKLALSVTLRERQVETTRVAERTEEVLRENGDLQRKLEGLGGEEEVDASLFVRHLLGLRRVLKVRVILQWDKPEGKSPPLQGSVGHCIDYDTDIRTSHPISPPLSSTIFPPLFPPPPSPTS